MKKRSTAAGQGIDTATWKVKARPAITNFQYIRGLALHPNGDWLFVSGYMPGLREGRFVLSWDLRAGKERYRKVLNWLSWGQFALSPDGSTLFAVEAYYGEGVRPEDQLRATVKAWDAASGKELASFAAPPAFDAHHAAFLPDGSTVATAGINHELRLWDLKAKKEKAAFPLQYGGTTNLAVSGGEKAIMAAGSRYGRDQGLVELFEAATGKRLAKLHMPHLNRIALSPDGKWLATGTLILKDRKKLGAVELWKMDEVLRKQPD